MIINLKLLGQTPPPPSPPPHPLPPAPPTVPPPSTKLLVQIYYTLHVAYLTFKHNTMLYVYIKIHIVNLKLMYCCITLQLHNDIYATLK